MAKLLPRKVLDKKIAQKLLKYYQLDPNKDVSDLEEWECFSHPTLNRHCCNIRAKLKGGHECNHCGHVVGRKCLISCDIQDFCLAVFGYRMGIGGKDFDEAIHHNLYKLTTEELYGEVIKVFALDGSEEIIGLESKLSTVDVDEDFIQESKGNRMQDVTNMNETETVNEIKTEEIETPQVPVVETQEITQDDELVTFKEAAELYGCTYANIYNLALKSKKLEVVASKGRTKFVRKSDVLDLSKSKRKSRTVKSVEVPIED